MKIRILGSGTSSGVPRIGNDWGVCDPGDPRNRRTRASVLVTTETTTILVDTSPDMREQLQAKFHYAFFGRALYRPTVEIASLPDTLEIGDIRITVADQPHGGITSAGLRFDSNVKSIGYATDFHEMTSDMRALYADLDIWVVDALRRAPHPTHPNLAQVLGWIRELGPRRSALVHMDQSMDYIRLAAELPAGVEPGFDGLEMLA